MTGLLYTACVNAQAIPGNVRGRTENHVHARLDLASHPSISPASLGTNLTNHIILCGLAATHPPLATQALQPSKKYRSICTTTAIKDRWTLLVNYHRHAHTPPSLVKVGTNYQVEQPRRGHQEHVEQRKQLHRGSG